MDAQSLGLAVAAYLEAEVYLAATDREVVVTEHECAVADSLVEFAVECEHAIGLSCVYDNPSCGTVRFVERTLYKEVLDSDVCLWVVHGVLALDE